MIATIEPENATQRINGNYRPQRISDVSNVQSLTSKVGASNVQSLTSKVEGGFRSESPTLDIGHGTLDYPSAQLGLLPEDQDIAQRFEVWKATRGGAQLLRFAYQETAQFAARFLRTGQRVSMDYIMHRLRDRIGAIKARLARGGHTLPKEGGYRINDHFTAHIARHIMSRRPEWTGLFEKRALGAKRMVARRKVTITEYQPT